MERFVRKHDKECMKMMMMKHEETFRQQVHELHRLYRLQKLLMMDMENKQGLLSDRSNAADSVCQKSRGGGGERRRRRRRGVLNLELPADEYIERAEVEEEEEEVLVEAEDGSCDDIDELKLSIGISPHRSRLGEDASLNTCDSGGSFSSSSTADQSGGGLMIRGEKSQIVGVDGIREEEGLEKEKLHPPWSLQCLSLKMA